MHVPNNARQHKRQNGAPPPVPSIAGITGGATASGTNTETSFLFNGAAPTSAPAAGSDAPALVPGSSVVVTSTGASAPATNPTTSPSAGGAASPSPSSSSSISTGTLIGAIVGAIAVFIVLVSLAVCFYKRSGKKVKRTRGAALPSPLSDSRNARGNAERRLSRKEPWAKMEGVGRQDEKEDVDVWEGMVPSPATDKGLTPPPRAITRETGSAAGTLDKLNTMFKKSPSIRSNDGTSSEGHSQLEFGETLAGSAQFAKYHPHLAEELAKTVTPVRAQMGREEAAPISWDGETVGDDSFLSLRGASARIESSHLSSASSAMSPLVVKVASTPLATHSEPHRWESAEVLHYESEDEAQNPFADDTESRKSLNNPFFNAGQAASMPRRRGSNPFSDASESRPLTHATQDSSDRAMQSLIAALNVSPEDVQDRLRIASMQSVGASVMSSGSAMDDVTSVTEFPLPPTQVPRGI